jgi:hypothetical protein
MKDQGATGSASARLKSLECGDLSPLSSGFEVVTQSTMAFDMTIFMDSSLALPSPVNPNTVLVRDRKYRNVSKKRQRVDPE